MIQTEYAVPMTLYCGDTMCKYGFIYLTSNNTNGRKYIGKRTYDENGEWKSYLGSGIAIKRAIEKYGTENFTRIIIDVAYSKSDLDDKERYWIQFYNAAYDRRFYNMTSGGDGGNTILSYTDKELDDYRRKKSKIHMATAPKGGDAPRSILTKLDVIKIIDRLKNNDYIENIANDYGVGYSTIHDIRMHRTWKEMTNDICFDNISTRRKPYGKAVAQFDLDGNLIATFKSARDAYRVTGISYKHISGVCNNDRRTAQGYIWRFV